MVEVEEGIHEVGGYSNAYIVDGDQGVVLIDTGISREGRLMTQRLAAIGRSPEDIAAIVITHAHTDHIGGAAALESASGAKVIGPRADTPAIQGEEPIPPPPLLGGPLRFLAGIGPNTNPVTVDYMVTEADHVGLPDDFSAIDTPGHTPGHTSYLLDRGDGIMFVGDAAARNRRGAVIRGFPNRRGGPQIDHSIRHLAEYEFDVAFFGHSSPIDGGAAEAFRVY